jgi:hypothetical protein
MKADLDTHQYHARTNTSRGWMPWAEKTGNSCYHVQHRFGSHGDIQQAVQAWLREQPKSFFFEGIKKLIEWYQKCIIMQGTMSKSNMCICSPSVELKLSSQNCLYFLSHAHIWQCNHFFSGIQPSSYLPVQTTCNSYCSVCTQRKNCSAT